MEESNTAEPTVKRFRRSLPELVIMSDVKNVMEHVLAKLNNQENTKLNAFLRDKIKDLKTDKRELVGVFGKTGAGKTSLINAVIEEKKLLPSGDVDACTSVMIRVEANMCNTKYEAHIEFITKEEWKEELWSINHHHENTEDDDYQDLAEKLSALYGEEWRQKSSEQLMDARYFRDIPEFLQSMKKILSCETAKELSAKIIKYTRTDSNQGGGRGIKRWYWPLVKCVTIKVPHNDFLQYVTLVDLPGNGDRNKSRDAMWKGIVGNCSTVWVVTEINRAASETASWDILKNVNSLIGNGGECRHIHIICTKSDVVESLDELSKAEVQSLVLKRNKVAKENVQKQLNKLTKIKKLLSDECFQVFTVSSREFFIKKHLSPENTEIPKLQDFLKILNDCHSETLNYVSGAHGILSLIHGASIRKEDGTNKEVYEAFEKNLSLQTGSIEKEITKIYSAFEECLQQGVEKSKSSCEKILHSTLYPKKRNGRGFHKQLRKAVENGGICRPKKGKKEMNINMNLTSSLTDSIDEKFREIFPNDGKRGLFNEVINKFSLGTEEAKQMYKDVELQLIFLKSEEDSLKSALIKSIRKRKKTIYRSLTQTVEESMQDCYTRAAVFTGTGTLNNMRETIEKHVLGSKDTMFENAKKVMINQMQNLKAEVIQRLVCTMKEAIELSLKTDDYSIPDVSEELQMVQNFHDELKRS